MAEYIEREALIEKIVNTPFGVNCSGETEEYKDGVLRGLVAKQNDIIEMVKSQPTADVAEVVRCKDCKNYKLVNNRNIYICDEYGGFATDNDYCSRAKRKDGETE